MFKKLKPNTRQQLQNKGETKNAKILVMIQKLTQILKIFKLYMVKALDSKLRIITKRMENSLQLENQQREKMGTQQSLLIQQETSNKEN